MAQKPQRPAGLFEVRPAPKGQWPAPQHANWFNISYVGPEVEISAGFLDLHDLAQASKGNFKGPLLAEPVARITMSVAGFAILQKQVMHIAESMKAKGRDLKSGLYEPGEESGDET